MRVIRAETNSGPKSTALEVLLVLLKAKLIPIDTSTPGLEVTVRIVIDDLMKECPKSQISAGVKGAMAACLGHIANTHPQLMYIDCPTPLSALCLFTCVELFWGRADQERQG